LPAFFFRSLIATEQYELVQKGIGAASAPELLALRLWATFKTTADDNRDLLLEQLKELTEHPALPTSPNLALVCSYIHFDAKNYKDAFKLVHKQHENLEMLALVVQIYLRVDRVGLAAHVVKAMQDIDDDDALTVLAAAWLGIAQGGEKVTEAFFLLQELTEKFGSSPTVLNDMAVCQIQLRDYTKAFGYLRQAREVALQSKQRVAADTLLNSIVALTHLRKPLDIIQRIATELRASSPAHPWLKRCADMDAAFNKAAENYKSGN